MTQSSASYPDTRDKVKHAISRTLPTAIAIVPVAMLCGLLAAQSGWSFMEALFFGALGFSGSGQLALLTLAEQGMGLLAMLLVAVSINSRYIPIALAATSRLPAKKIPRSLVAHMLGDEAYVVENGCNAHGISLITIRLVIYITWVLFNAIGAIIFFSIPEKLLPSDMHLGFPASIVLFTLSLKQIKARIPLTRQTCIRYVREIAICATAAFLFFTLLGNIWFWLPSIAFSTWRIRFLR